MYWFKTAHKYVSTFSTVETGTPTSWFAPRLIFTEMGSGGGGGARDP
jgi:hypothetical protein